MVKTAHHVYTFAYTYCRNVWTYSHKYTLCNCIDILTIAKPCNSFILLILLSNPKQPSCKKVCGPQKGYGEKRCEIQGGGQEMAVMVG